MPKIIENLREQIVEEAKKQLMEGGYGKTTIRSVASACGIGVGTVYNYFKSKELLISAFMLDDWYKCTIRMSELDPSDTDGFFRGVLAELKGFSEKYSYLFQDKDAASALSSVYTERHEQLRTMLARLIKPACKKGTGRFEDENFLPVYIAESILFFTMSETSIEDQMKALRLLACDE
ncbi:TetR/AcrR family transcriptional regulator [Butyrivibrio sp. MC2021]|uniref:TetR/AcrR family transcriptional regulator n=1 Tax=Butyrivibrio sp. MC2021 TaxID=1408306 RepID=UPI000684B68D|nr:TetR/AcrR family transcriptional regulator [Butyrivibrio sp. MC2021]